MSWADRMRKRNEERRDRINDLDREERRERQETERRRRREELNRFYRDQQVMKIMAERAKETAAVDEARRLQVEAELEETLARKELERQQQAASEESEN